jgi:hypothetical protein
MTKILTIITGAPIYVWFIFAYLVFIGVKNLKTRVVYLPKLFIIPFVMLALKYNLFLSKNSFMFILMITLGAVVSFFAHANTKIKIVKNLKSVELKGGYSAMIILMSFFFIKYLFGYLEHAKPELFSKYYMIEIILSGLFSGFFIGRAIRYMYLLRRYSLAD